jgi:hypothetical protein
MRGNIFYNSVQILTYADDIDSIYNTLPSSTERSFYYAGKSSRRDALNSY